MTMDPTKVSFSQAQGYEPLPRQLQLGELPYNARMSFWNAFYITDRKERPHYGKVTEAWNQVLMDVHSSFFYEGLDEFDADDDEIYEIYKPYLLDTSFNKVFDLIVFMVRHPQCPNRFIARVLATFLRHPLAYVFDHKTGTIYPAATPEEGKAIVDAVHELDETGLSGARQHLIEASTLINQGHWANSIKESISAVESVAREIAPGTRNLGSALNQLGHRGMFENASLRNGLEKLYEYTNEEGGIRHARLNEDASNVGQDEAVFMLGACASFASYLWRKGLGATS